MSRILFLFEPETAHELAKFFLRLIVKTLPLKPSLINNPLGLAAGFDKNAEILDLLPYLGFGHAEIGTVTPKPQGGNERPRLFRDTKKKSIFNRMGFNNLGAGVISERVRKIKPALPSEFKVGINLGKNKSTPDSEAPLDYAKVAESFIDCADFFVINVSSPNTPGLRALQSAENLLPIIKSVQEVVAKHSKSIPIQVKLSPELPLDTLKTLIPLLETAKISGLVLTNTLQGDYIYREKTLSGGWSGQILSTPSLNRLIEVRKLTTLTITSVGGIMTKEDAVQRIKAGADRIQIYSGWIYAGLFFPRQILDAIKSNKA